VVSLTHGDRIRFAKGIEFVNIIGKSANDAVHPCDPYGYTFCVVAGIVLAGAGNVFIASLADTFPRPVSITPIQKPVFAIDSRSDQYVR
jgi:hypothetical protein